jgi:hypothetical protein
MAWYKYKHYLNSTLGLTISMTRYLSPVTCRLIQEFIDA